MPIINSTYEERIERFFDNKAMLDSKYLHSPLMFNKVNMYLNYYSGENGIDMHIAIDDILMATYDNYDVYGYCISQILSFLNREGFKDLIEYVVSEYIGDEFDMITNRSLRKQIEGMSKLTIGSVAPDLFIPDMNGNKVGLHDLYRKNKLNLLFFWSSKCPHCMKLIPKIKTIYESYRSAGLEVIALSIDKKKEEWQHVIDQENLEWINISNLKGWDSESTDVYYVSSTPTFYLVDNQTKIVGRPDGKEEVIDLVNNLLR
jgi:peroxiredoxin